MLEVEGNLESSEALMSCKALFPFVVLIDRKGNSCSFILHSQLRTTLWFRISNSFLSFQIQMCGYVFNKIIVYKHALFGCSVSLIHTNPSNKIQINLGTTLYWETALFWPCLLGNLEPNMFLTRSK